MSLFDALIIAIVEGLTEFLPVSSTGHMIITQHFLGLESSAFIKAFIINIQFGAIFSVVVLYFRRFLQSLGFYYKLIVAFFPAAIAGFLLSSKLDILLDSVLVVAISLVAGGILLLFVDRWFAVREKNENISYKNAFIIGLFQCIAMIPGVSRSAATIVGGMTQGLDRKTAAEFSFFLAVPTLFAASAYKLLESYKDIPGDSISLLVFGNIIAFVVGMAAIKSFVTFLGKHGFLWFGVYRIVLGGILLVLLGLGIDLSMV